MNKELEKKRILDLVDVYNNVRVPLSAREREKIKKIFPYYGAQGIVDYVDDFLFDGEYLLVAEDGENLRSNNQNICNLVKGKFWVNNHAHILKANGENCTNYLFYNFNRIRFELYVTGSAQPKLNKENLLNIETYVHSKTDQKRIASVLSAFDDRIKLNSQINAELEEMAKTLFDYWFVQFDFPDKNGKPYKSSGGKMKYSVVLNRDIPESWGAGVLEEVLSLEYGKPLKESDRLGDRYPVMGSNGIIGYHKEYLVKGPGIVIGRKGSAGEITWVDSDFFPIDTTYFVKNNNGQKTLIHSYYLLKNINLKKVESSSAVPGLNRNVVHSFRTEIPPSEIIEEFHLNVGAFYKRMEISRQQNQQLSTLRDWLLPMLMNSQVKVNIDASIEENSSMAAEPEVPYEKEIQLNIPTNKKGFAKQVLAGKIVSEFKDDTNFTDIKFQKIQYLAEHIIEADLNLNYYYQAAGPYDNKFMHSIYNDFHKQKWFDYQNKKFTALEKQDKIDQYYKEFFAPAQKQLDKLFDLLKDTSEAEAEIIATLYAVWNNHIIAGKIITDSDLLASFYQWSERKHQYAEEQILIGLQWLRNYQMEPRGFGRLIKTAKIKNREL